MSGNIRDREMNSIRRLVRFLRLARFTEIEDAQPIDGEIVGDNLPDACAKPFIIEHTSIDGIPNLRSDDARFLAVVADIEKNFENQLGFGLRIVLEVGAIPTGCDWSEVNKRLRSWILADARNLADGVHNHFAIGGVPFPLRIKKNTAPRINGVRFFRLASKDNEWLAQDVPNQLKKKIRKVNSYITKEKEYSGYRPLLLVESRDSALVGPDEILSAFRNIDDVGSCSDLAAWHCHLTGENEVTYLDLVSGELFLFDHGSGSVVCETWITA